MTAAVTADRALHGRNKITSRAVRRVVSAVTATGSAVVLPDMRAGESYGEIGLLDAIPHSPDLTSA